MDATAAAVCRPSPDWHDRPKQVQQMPLARIFSTAAPEDISALASYLRGLGYEVEYAVARGQAKLRPADLEVDVEPCAAGEALSRASRMAAEIGGDVFLAPGALSV